MRALALEHLHSNPIGVYGDVLADRGIEFDRVQLDRGDFLPDWRDYDLLVVMGGGMSAYEENEYPWLVEEKRTIREAVSAGRPYFGVCLGSQLLAGALGGRVYRGPAPELGVIPMFLSEAARRDPVFRGLPPDLEVFQWHCDTFTLPDGATRLARSPRYENQAFRYGNVAYAIQCHLETTLEDVHDWFASWPSLGTIFEERYGRGSLEAFLDEYAATIPHLRSSARQLFRRWLENALAYGTRAAGRVASSHPKADDLLGRDAEQARLRELVASARAGRGGALAVVGPAGIGKTALLDVAESDATGMRVLRTAGLDRVAAPPLAGLADLCRPLLDVLPALPEVEARALAAALGDGDGSGVVADRFTVYLAAANLLVAASRAEPLLVVVDEAHLLDEPSREAVGVAAGRVSGVSIALVVATEGAPPESTDVVELGPLERVDALTLLDRHFGAGLASTVAADVAEAAGGNPLALLEIPRGLSAAQRSGAEPVAPVLESVRSAEHAYLSRISTLPQDTRQALVVAALSNGEPAAVLERALTEIGLRDGVFDSAVAAGLLERTGSDVVFGHELARATVAYSALRSERRAAHAALALATNTPDARAWHRVLALAAPDEGAAADLAATAESAARRGVWATAARAFARAARVTPDAAARADRLVAAADAAQRAGSIAAAIDHLEEAIGEMPLSEEQAEAELLLGNVLARSGSAGRARDVLLDAAATAACSPGKRSHLLSAAVVPTLRAGDPAAAIATGRKALALAAPDGLDELSALVALGTALALAGEHVEARAHALRARTLASDGQLGASPSQLAYIGFALRLVGERTAARDELERAIDVARSTGLMSTLPYALVRLADVDLEDGSWQDARRRLEEAAALALETGQPADRGLALAGLAWIAAAQGRDADCRRMAAQALELADRLGAGSRLQLALPALGLLELGCGHGAVAAAYLSEARAEQRGAGWRDAGVPPHKTPDLVEALLAVGSREEAATEAAAFEEEARRIGRASAAAAAARCYGMLSSDDELDRWFGEALRPGPEVIGVFEDARTRLSYGERLIAAGRTEDAARQLSDAHGAFAALGAEPWRLRAERALG